jgi:hypothetical protein
MLNYAFVNIILSKNIFGKKSACVGITPMILVPVPCALTDYKIKCKHFKCSVNLLKPSNNCTYKTVIIFRNWTFSHHINALLIFLT